MRLTEAMRPFALCFCVFLAAAIPLRAQDAPDTQVGDFLFKMPIGWNRTSQGDITYIKPPFGPEGTSTFFALGADKLQSDLRTSFNILWDGFKKQNRVLEGGQILAEHSPNGYDAFYTRAMVSDANGRRWKVFVLGARFKRRIETVLFMTNAFGRDLAATNQQVFDSFLKSLRFTDKSAEEAAADAGDAERKKAGAPAARLHKGQGKFDGIYRAVGQTGDPLSPQRGIGYKYVAFFSDGRFLEKLPDEGLEKLNEDVEIRINPTGWGTYEMNGDVGRIVFPPDEYSRNPIVWAFKEYSDHLKLRGDDYYLLDRCNDLKLQGTFRRSDYKTTNAARQGITFTPAGKFVDEGVLAAAGVMVRNAAGNYDFDDGAPGRGTYRIVNYTLELSYANGRVKRASFLLDPEMSKTAVTEFFLNTWKFKRVQ
ncbi:MAG TPA: hypothetical protein VE263_22160 [Candidatus Angelobacter sp.]|nr:hypothetical protein [Candidatus Angelobacter sp.]